MLLDILCTFVRYKSFRCSHTRKAETKNNSRIMQSSSFILGRSFLLEYFRKQNKCDLTLLGLKCSIYCWVLFLFASMMKTKSLIFPCSSEGIIACLIQKYFRSNFRLKIKNLKNIEAKKISAFFYKRENRKESILNLLKHTACCEKFFKQVHRIRYHGKFIRK